MIQPNAETVREAEQMVRSHLANLAGRDAEALTPLSERQPFGAHIHLKRGSPDVDALFTEIGFPYATDRERTFRAFIEMPDWEQERCLTQLVQHSKKHAQFHDMTMWLYHEVALSGRLTQPFMSALFREAVEMDRPDEPRGSEAGRNALILNLIEVLTSEFELPAVANRVTIDENTRRGVLNNDACGIVVRVLNDEFPTLFNKIRGCQQPALNLSHGGVRNVWERYRKLSRQMARDASTL